MAGPAKKPLADRLWPKVDKSGGAAACWPWTAARDPKGYGTIRSDIGRANKFAHRAAWEVTNGAIPDGLLVCHRCDNPPCCNPAHLFLGTHADNMADCSAKGRTCRGDRHGSRLHPENRPRGDRHGARLRPETTPRGDAHYSRRRPELVLRGMAQKRAVLTDEKVRMIRRACADGAGYRAIAAALGLNEATVRLAAIRRTWKHVE